jgi:hypothetical protein
VDCTEIGGVASRQEGRKKRRRLLMCSGLTSGERGSLLQEMIPTLASAASNVDIMALIGQVIGGGVGGAILTVLAGVTKWMVVPPKST